MIEIKEKKPIKVFISQPMSGLSMEEIMKTRERGFEEFLSRINEEVEVILIDNVNHPNLDELTATPFDYLGEDIVLMKDADYIFFVEGWENSRGCNIEHCMATTYNIPVMFE